MAKASRLGDAAEVEQRADGNPKKRRKVNHACVYCRRSHMVCDLARPCTRCQKRNIGHLCHDEPRDLAYSKAERTRNITTAAADGAISGNPHRSPRTAQSKQSLVNDQATSLASLGPTVLPTEALDNGNAGANIVDFGNLGASYSTNGQDAQNFYSSYLFNATDIGSEFNVLDNFLNTNLFEDGPSLAEDGSSNLDIAQTLPAASGLGIVRDDSNGRADSNEKVSESAASQLIPAAAAATISRPRSAKPSMKDEERFYLNIADPSGNDKPEERMKRLLEAKFAAGLLRPFNYVQGYTRLNTYLEDHMHPTLRQRMMLQIDKFRPKFREKMQSLTDMELTMVEMWFERTLMEYERVFASLPIPACCWRRTGEIFRGNKAMAELIHVPVDKLRDGQLALHEIMAEKDLVSYWDNFIAIAFDNSQKGMLTSCSLKSQDPHDGNKEFKCCFSFTVRRDAQHNIPSLIVGNFVPRLSRQAS